MIVTLLTDFGTADYFVAAMKAAMLRRNASIRFVDVSHEVPAHSIDDGAFTLLAVQRDFPVGTVHLVVVDPGVGSDRRAIAARVDEQFLVGPDNGVLAWTLERAETKEVRRIENGRLTRQDASSTFHGRDIFAPTAAALADGFPFEEVGDVIEDWVRLPEIDPRPHPQGWEGRILHIDAFGNCVTNLTREGLRTSSSSIRLVVNETEVDRLVDHFAQGASGEPVAYWGSAGFLEIGINRGSAAEELNAERGDPVIVVVSSA